MVSMRRRGSKVAPAPADAAGWRTQAAAPAAPRQPAALSASGGAAAESAPASGAQHTVACAQTQGCCRACLCVSAELLLALGLRTMHEHEDAMWLQR